MNFGFFTNTLENIRYFAEYRCELDTKYLIYILDVVNEFGLANECSKNMYIWNHKYKYWKMSCGQLSEQLSYFQMTLWHDMLRGLNAMFHGQVHNTQAYNTISMAEG